MIPVETFNLVGALFTIGLDIFILAVVLGALLQRAGSAPDYMRHIRKNAFEIAFGIALIAVLGSLYYSEIIGFLPCVLCWWQRVFMVPLSILLGIAVWRRDRHIVEYAITFAVLGSLFAAYNYALEWSGGALPCPSRGAVSCALRYVFEFGFVTIPFMSLSSFVAILAALLVRERRVEE